MAEMVNFIWRWLESGDDHATGNAKSTWNETKDIFKMVMDALTSISKKLPRLYFLFTTFYSLFKNYLCNSIFPKFVVSELA